MQADIDQNESDADAAIAALQTDVDGNEADADAAIAALQANTAPGTIVGQMNYWNGTSWQTINPGNTGSVLQLVGTTPTWVLNPDIVAPVITLTGNATVTIELGAIYTDAGATATDLSGDITVTTSGTVDTSTIGSYIITYTATDASGNEATAVVRTVNVVDDTTAPVITVTSGTDTVRAGSTWTDAGATADGGETVTTSGTVDTSTIGTYTKTYSATDASGNVGTATRTVTVEVVVTFYQGGIVFLLDGSGGGLIAAVEDQSSDIKWYDYAFTTTGATATYIGTGSANTDAIISDQGAPETSYAAGLARAYTGGGFTDWFLPSKNELNQMYTKKAIINTTASANGGSNFSANYYWSSTESYNVRAWMQYFGNGYQEDYFKNYTCFVRAVRAF
jgi:hypothetical protein